MGMRKRYYLVLAGLIFAIAFAATYPFVDPTGYPVPALQHPVETLAHVYHGFKFMYLVYMFTVGTVVVAMGLMMALNGSGQSSK